MLNKILFRAKYRHIGTTYLTGVVADLLDTRTKKLFTQVQNSSFLIETYQETNTAITTPMRNGMIQVNKDVSHTPTMERSVH